MRVGQLMLKNPHCVEQPRERFAASGKPCSGQAHLVEQVS
jgi:hypothetical protein